MRSRIILFILSFASLHSLIAQTCLFENSLPDLNCSRSQANAIVAADSSGWIVAGWIGDCYTAYIAKLDCNGDVLWQNYAGGYAKFVHAVLCENGDVLAVGYDWGTDDVPEDEFALICRYTANGGKVFQKNYIPEPGNGSIYFSRVVEASNGSIFAVFNDQVLHLDSNGDSLATIPIGYGEINSISVNHRNDIIAGCDSGIAVLDTLGTILQRIPLGAVGPVIQNSQHQYVAVVNGNLNLLDTVFNVVVATTSGNFIALEPGDTGFFALAQHKTAYYDWNLTWLNDVWFATASDFAVSHDRVAIAGVDNYQINRMLIQVIDHQGASVERKTDIKIESVQLTELLGQFYDSIPFGPVLYDYQFSVDVTVTNVGADTIKNFGLLSQSVGGMNCADWRFSKVVSNITLAAGDTTVQTLGGTLFSRPGGSAFRMCVYAIAPNKSLEINKANNSSCSTDVILSQEHKMNSVPFALFPNPCSDKLYLQLETTRKAVAEIFSVDGAIVSRSTIASGTNVLSVESLSPGFYIAKITLEGNVVVCKKLVKL